MHIGFVFSGYSVKLKAMPFTLSQSCYSVPMLRGVKIANSLTRSDNLTFTKGMKVVSGTAKEVVLIKAGGNYYDLTDDPR